MDRTLVGSFAQRNARTEYLRNLMRICRTGAQYLHIVCVGAGDAFINRYWPALKLAINRKKVKLTVVDNDVLATLIEAKLSQASQAGFAGRRDHLKSQYDDFAAQVQSGRDVKYLSQNEPLDRSWYDHIKADIVFILVPDEAHITEARKWLKRSTLILVEKPYNQDLQQADLFERELRELVGTEGDARPFAWVVPFDHYLAKIAEYVALRDSDQLVGRVGELKAVEFALLEPDPVEPWRADSLSAGMAYDLFSHVLAMLSVELDLDRLDLNALKEVKAARHQEAPAGYAAETFAHFALEMYDFHGARVAVKGAVGKGVGTAHQKYVDFICDRGQIHFDLNPGGGKFVYIQEGQNLKVPLYRVKAGHPETIETLLRGDYMRMPLGGLTGSAAIKILSLLNSIRERVQRARALQDYKVGTPWDQVQNVARPLRL